MLNNEDFYGTRIRNEDDPLVRQALDVVGHVATQFVPFAVRGQQQLQKSEAPLAEQVLPFVGITAAPASITHSPAEELASKLMRAKMPRGSRTAGQATEARFKADAAKQLAGKKLSVDEIKQAAEKQSIHLSAQDLKSIEKRSQTTPLEFAVNHLDAADAAKVWEAASAKEKESIGEQVAKKIANSTSLSPKEQAALAERLGDIGKKALHEQQVHHAVLLAKKLMTSAPAKLTPKEHAAGMTREQKRQEWLDERANAKEQLTSSKLDREEVMTAVRKRLGEEIKNREHLTEHLRAFLREMNWMKMIGEKSGQ